MHSIHRPILKASPNWHKALCLLATLSFFPTLSAAQEETSACPAVEGSTYEVMSGTDFGKRFEKLPSVRGDFETTAEFEARRISEISDLIGKELFVSVATDNGSIRYEADSQHFFLTEWFFSNTSRDFTQDALFAGGLLKQYGKNFGNVTFFNSDEQTGTYSASNAIGTKVEVIEQTQFRYHLAEMLPASNQPKNFRFSLFEMPETAMMPDAFGQTMVETSVASISVPIERAKELNGTLQAGVVLVMDHPGVFFHEQHYPPTISLPLDSTVKSIVVTVDILCGFVFSPDGQILKVVELTPQFR